MTYLSKSYCQRIFIILFVITISILFFGSNAEAADYYVSSIRNGRSDSNTGTDPNKPWATFQKVKDMWNNLQAGDTVHLERGSYWEWSGEEGWYVRSGGTSSGVKTIRGDDYGDQSKSKPIYKRVGDSTHGTAAINIERSYISIRDFVIDGGHASRSNLHTTGIVIGNTQSGSRFNVTNVKVLNMRLMNLGGDSGGPGDKYICGISLSGYSGDTVSDTLIEGNEVSDYGAHGLKHYTEANTNNIIWRNNYVHNNYSPRWQGSVGEPLAISMGGYGNVFEYNYLEDTTSQYAGITIWNRFGKSDTSAAQIRYNIVKNSNSGIFIEGAQDGRSTGQEVVLADFYGNIFFNNKNEGIRAANDPNATFGSGSKIKIYNNILYNNGLNRVKPWGSLINEIAIDKPDTEFEIKNNIIFGTNSNALMQFISYKTLSATNNLLWSSSGGNNTLIDNKGVKYNATNITQFDAKTLFSNPYFTNVNNLPTSINSSSGPNTIGFAPQTNSPIINSGADLGTKYNKSIDGVSRPQGPSWDIGVYEQGGSTNAYCTLDTWEYGTWGSCVNGIKTRTAVKTFDCPFGDTPSESTTMSCNDTTTTPSLIGWYRFNEGYGSFLNDSTSRTQATGSSSGVNWSSGIEGKSLVFNGSNSFAQISMKDMSPYQGSVSLWAYFTQFGDHDYLFGETTGSWKNSIQLYTTGTNGTLTLGLSGVHPQASNIATLPLNKWTHVVLNWVNNQYEVYVDGSRRISNSFNGLTGLNSFADVGNNGEPSYRVESPFAKIDDVRLYSAALSGSKIKEIYDEMTLPTLPVCSADVYSYGSWGECSSSGTQTRTVTKTFDCAGTETKPDIDSRSCIPSTNSCTQDIWSYGSWSNCSASGLQTRTARKSYDCPGVDTPSDITSAFCVPNNDVSCSLDEWSYTLWTPCSVSGVQTRGATKTYNCPNIETLPDEISRACFPAGNGFAINTNVDRYKGKIQVNPLKYVYAQDEEVSILALPNTGYYFSSWSGDISGSFNPMKIKMNAGKNIQANFIPISAGYIPTTQTQVSNIQSQITNIKLILLKNLYRGLDDSQVIILQKILNKDSDTKLVSITGAGLPGKETTYFGNVTEEAVKKFQRKYNIATYGNPGYGLVGPLTRAKMNSLGY